MRSRTTRAVAVLAAAHILAWILLLALREPIPANTGKIRPPSREVAVEGERHFTIVSHQSIAVFNRGIDVAWEGLRMKLLLWASLPAFFLALFADQFLIAQTNLSIAERSFIVGPALLLGVILQWLFVGWVIAKARRKKAAV